MSKLRYRFFRKLPCFGRARLVSTVCFLVLPAGLVAQAPLQLPPDPPEPFYTNFADASDFGYLGIVPDKKVLEHANYPFDELDAEIARWEKFLDQARQELAAIANSKDPKNVALAARLNQLIPTAESHLAVLLQQKKLRGDDPDNCGLGGLLADWDALLKFAEQQHQQLDAAAAIARSTQGLQAGMFTRTGGVAAESLNAASVLIVQRQMEEDNEFIRLANTSMKTIRENCDKEKVKQTWEEINRKLADANVVAEKAAKEAEALAEDGQFGDEEAITNLVTKVMLAAKANQIAGNGDLGLEQQKKTQNIFRKFIASASEKCIGQSFPVLKAFAAERMNELYSMGADLDLCMTRLYEANGLTNELLPYRLRHCGPYPNGVWKLQVTRGTVEGSYGKLEGETEIPEFGATVPIQGTENSSFSATYMETGPALLDVDGRIGDAHVTIGDMRVTGTIRMFLQTFTMKPGVAVSQELKMHVELQKEGFNATPNDTRTATHLPGGRAQSVDLPITIGNRNRPCDPKADIWSYASGQ